MKIGWVDNRVRQGVRLTIERLIETAPTGVRVVRLSGRHFDRLCDLFICSGIETVSHPNWDFIMKHPHIFYIQDYMLMSPNWQRLRIAQMINTASLVIFQSPMHRGEFIRLHHGLGQFKYPAITLCPAAVDTSLFLSLVDEEPPTNEEQPKKKKTRKRSAILWAGGSFAARKGISQVADWSSENKSRVDLYAYGKPPAILKGHRYCKTKDPVPYEHLSEVYQLYKKFIYLPTWKEPFGRTVAEATLSGLEIITNANVGLLSFPWGRDPLLVRQHLDEAPQAFWNAIQTYTKGISIRR